MDNMPDSRRRETAYKLRIGEILRGKPVLIEQNAGLDGKQQKFSFLELGNKKIVRVNIVANVIDKFVSEGEKKFATLTLDDASGQINVKSFGESVSIFNGINQGHTILTIGVLRYFNNELYILPEIVKICDSRYLLVRKLEIEKSVPKQEIKKEEIVAIKDQIVNMIKKEEQNGGIDSEKLIMEISASPELINQEIRKLLEEGIIYEPRPGKLRYLG